MSQCPLLLNACNKGNLCLVCQPRVRISGQRNNVHANVFEAGNGSLELACLAGVPVVGARGRGDREVDDRRAGRREAQFRIRGEVDLRRHDLARVGGVHLVGRHHGDEVQLAVDFVTDAFRK